VKSFTITTYINIEATTAEAALLWAEQVMAELSRKQEAINSIGQIEVVEEKVDQDTDPNEAYHE
jgi:hypothetical protein